jgi:NTE family protein
MIAAPVLPRQTSGMTALSGSEPDMQRPNGSPVRLGKIRPRRERAGIVVALGGGFSRGFAHLGVLDVLEQEQIPVSGIVGTSIGALLGAAFADGISPRELCELGRRVRVRDFMRFQHSDRNAQRKDLISQFVGECFRASGIEDLPIPTAIVTTDLDTGAPHVFRKGALDVAIRASCAFPGLFKPVEHEGRLLADGCIVAPVPTAIAAQIHGRRVLGVAVSSNSAGTSSSENVVRVRKAFDPGLRRSRRAELEPSWSRHAEVLLEPEVHHIGWNDFSRVDEAFAAGADAMRRALPHVLELMARRTPLQAAPEITGRAESGLAL